MNMNGLQVDGWLTTALLAQSGTTGGESLSLLGWALVAVAVVVGIPLLIVGLIFLIAPVFRLLGAILKRVLRFIGAEFSDAIRGVGMWITALVLSVITLFNVVLGRWSAARHYGRAVQGELTALGGCVYRLTVGNPARLVFLEGLVEGLERRLPVVVASAPGATGVVGVVGGRGAGEARHGDPASPAPRRGDDESGSDAPTLPVSVPVRPKDAGRSRSGQFDGYEIVGTLPGGGSGSRLYIARPSEIRRAAFARDGQGAVGDVVIKSFSIAEGSSLPSIIRESRALEAAKKLGLVLDHQLSHERFYYVMRYVPGDSLAVVTQRLHASSPAGGLGDHELARAVQYVSDLVATLDQYHRAGLWHKDIKPDNIIVQPEPPLGDGRAHLVDFGLLTPLRGTMTLTTHGTEYFRDPEMVRMALRGVKVHEVDGARFDVYGAGAVLYAVLENSFPASGGLSPITRACPEALKWVVRRAMTDYARRYPSAAAMLADLRVVQSAARAGTLSSLRVTDLPSMRDGAGGGEVPGAGSPAVAVPSAPVEAPPALAAPAFAHPAPPAVAFDGVAAGARRSAREQLQSARARIAERRERMRQRRGLPPPPPGSQAERGPSAGVIAALGVVFVGTMITIGFIRNGRATVTVKTESGPKVTIAGAAGTTTPVSTRDRARRSSRESAPAPSAAGGVPVLVLREPAVFLDPLAADAARQVEALKAAGFVLIGEDEGTRAHGDELAAKVRLAVGAQVLGSESTGDTVRAWLDQHAEGAPRIVVWMTSDLSSEPRLASWVVASSGVDSGTLKACEQALRAE